MHHVIMHQALEKALFVVGRMPTTQMVSILKRSQEDEVFTLVMIF